MQIYFSEGFIAKGDLDTPAYIRCLLVSTRRIFTIVSSLKLATFLLVCHVTSLPKMPIQLWTSEVTVMAIHIHYLYLYNGQCLFSRKYLFCPWSWFYIFWLPKNVPWTPHLLATLFTMTLLSRTTPICWSISNITLVHKSGSTSDPSNFKMIAVSSFIGRTFHLILAARFQFFLLSNKLIDTSFQKPFYLKWMVVSNIYSPELPVPWRTHIDQILCTAHCLTLPMPLDLSLIVWYILLRHVTNSFP